MLCVQTVQSHHIADLFCQVDDLFAKDQGRGRGRPAGLSRSEFITFLVWGTLVGGHTTIKGLYWWMRIYHKNEFPHLPQYSAFVDQCQVHIPDLVVVLEQLFVRSTAVRWMDSTMVEVCTLERAHHHKTAKGMAKYGYNHQGVHYGLKLHLAIDEHGKLCAAVVSPANMHDSQVIPQLINQKTRIAVGDRGYTTTAMKQHVWDTNQTLVLTPPHYKQTRRLITGWQHTLLNMRAKIESVFDYLKNHLGLTTTFARSEAGYLFHILLTLVSYQIMHTF